MPFTRKLGLAGQPAGPTPTTTGMRAPTNIERLWDTFQDKIDFVPDIVKDFTGLPRRDVPRDDTQIPDFAISWFNSPELRKASGDNLIKILRSRHAEGTPMRDMAEKAYANYPRTFAHMSDVDNAPSSRSAWGTHWTENPSNKFLDVPIHDEFGDPAGTVPKLKTTRQSVLADTGAVENYIKDVKAKVPQPQNPRRLAIGNTVSINKDILGSPDAEQTFRHEMNHLAQNIRRPEEIRDIIEKGRGQIKGIRNPGTDIKHLDYKLEPIEVGARTGQTRGLDKVGARPRMPKGDNLAEIEDLIANPEKPWPLVRKTEGVHDTINKELDRIISDYQTHINNAPDKPRFNVEHVQSSTSPTGWDRVEGKRKVLPSKDDYVGSQSKTLAAAFKKINEHVLPHFNKARPAEDPLVFALRNTRVPNIEGILKDPSRLGDMIKEIRISRLSQLK